MTPYGKARKASRLGISITIAGNFVLDFVPVKSCDSWMSPSKVYKTPTDVEKDTHEVIHGFTVNKGEHSWPAPGYE